METAAPATSAPAPWRQWLRRSLMWTGSSVAVSVAPWLLGVAAGSGFHRSGGTAWLIVLGLSNMLGCWLLWRRAIWSFHPLIERPTPGTPWWVPPLATSWWIVLVLLGVGWLLLAAAVVLLVLAVLAGNQGFNLY